MAAANLLQYALQLVASRALNTNGFGAFGALLGLGVVGAVPMLALQTVTARHVALGRPAETARLVTLGLRIGVALSLLLPLAAPLVAAFLHVPVLAAVFLGLSLGPLAVAGTAQGVLQGRERFGALALLFLGISAVRIVVPTVVLLVSPTVTSGLAGAAVLSSGRPPLGSWPCSCSAAQTCCWPGTSCPATTPATTQPAVSWPAAASGLRSSWPSWSSHGWPPGRPFCLAPSGSSPASERQRCSS